MKTPSSPRRLIVAITIATAAILASCSPKEEPEQPTPPTPQKVAVASVALSQSSLALETGATASLTATVQPVNATDKTVTWSTSNGSVASVSGGTVTAVAAGTATITATADGKSASCQVTVSNKVIAVSSVTLDKTEAELEPEGTMTLSVTVKPDDATDKAVTWSSSDESIAIVKDGLVTALKEGSVTIKATAGGKEATCKVTVAKQVISVESITLDKTEASLEPEQTLTLTATVVPEDATDPTVTWTSSDAKVASVDKDGKVTAVAEGTATITATAGDKTATCEVTVKQPEYIAKERAALTALYNANDGDNWSNNDYWLSDKPLDKWYGIKMTSDGKHVASVKIQNARGYIPKEIADLTELETLNISNDSDLRPDAYYPLPSEIGTLKNLKKLWLQSYPIKGTLPNTLFDLISLEELRITRADNLQEGPIPSDIGKLTNLESLSLAYCNLTGQIPSEIGRLSGLKALNLSGNRLSGNIPESFGNLINLASVDLSSNQLSGEIPIMVCNLDNYWDFWTGIFRGNSYTMGDLAASKIPAPQSPPITTLSGKTLDIEEEFRKNQYTVLLQASLSNGSVKEFINSLVPLYNANKDKGFGVITYIDNNSHVGESERTAKDNEFKELLKKSGAKWESFIRHMYGDNDPGPLYSQSGIGIYPHASTFEATVIGPENTVVYSTILDRVSNKKLDNTLTFIQDVLKYSITYYESKSYSQDGKYEQLQKATTGNGVDLVITGDAFSDRLITDGTFKKLAKQAVADLFSVEPYKSMKNRFNIYLVNAVSKHEEYFNGCSTAFSGRFGSGSNMNGDQKKALEYAKKVVPDSRMDNVVVLVLMNTIRNGGTTYMMNPSDKKVYAAGASSVWLPYKDLTITSGVSNRANTLVHEVGGHGFAKLGDEYSYRDYGRISDTAVNFYRDMQQEHWYMNLDFTSDPSEVLWSRFIGDKTFSGERLGTYEGGLAYWSGVWRSTEQSVMNSSLYYSTFNAPCRSQIYTRIMKLSEGSSWTYQYSDFVTWDKAHPTTTRAATRSIVEVDDDAPVHVPPIHVHKTWKEVIEGR